MVCQSTLNDQTVVSFDRNTNSICMNSDIIKVLAVDDEVWFRGKELAMALGYNDPRDAVQKHVDITDKTPLHLLVQRMGGVLPPMTHKESQSLWVSESGFYSLTFGSKLPAAKAFKKWVTGEVLPSIRKTGRYVQNDEHALLEAYDGMPVIYLGDIGDAMLKFGWSDYIKVRTRDHKKDFPEFTLLRVFSTSNNRQVEKLLKEHPELKPHRLSKEIKGKNQTELLALSDSFRLSHVEAIIHKVIAKAPPAILEDIKQSLQLQLQDKDVEIKKLDVELESKRLQTQLELRRLELDHALQMAKLKAASPHGDRIDDTEMVEVDAEGAIPATYSMDTDEPPGEQASQPPEEDAYVKPQPYSVKLPWTLAAVWEIYIYEVKPRDAAMRIDARQNLYDSDSNRRKSLSLLRIIAEELENRSRVLGAPLHSANAGIQAAIQSLDALGLNSVNALAQHLVQYQFRSKGTGAPNWKKASTLRPEAFPTLHAMATQISEARLVDANEDLLQAAQEEAKPNKGLTARLQLVADCADGGPWNTAGVVHESKCWLVSCFAP